MEDNFMLCNEMCAGKYTINIHKHPQRLNVMSFVIKTMILLIFLDICMNSLHVCIGVHTCVDD